jgi:hypothetical protein
MDEARRRRGRWLRGLACAALALVAVLTPICVVPFAPGLLESSYGARHVPFELLGLTGSLALAAVALERWRSRPAASWRERLPWLLPLLVCFHYLVLVSEYARKPFDYDCYEYAARALIAGGNPWFSGLIYLYPPLTAQALAAAFHAVSWLAAASGGAPDPEASWDTVFYLYQCAQLALIGLAFPLLVRFARAAGIAATPALLGVAALLLFDNPLLRTLRHGQVNLFVLDAALAGLLLARRAPAAAGSALAFAIHLKLYPLFVLPALVAGRRGRALLATLAGVAVITVVLADFGRDWTLWREFAAFFWSYFPGERAFRNNSLYSVVWNTLRFATGAAPPELRPAVGSVVRAATLAVAAWFALRGFARERIARAQRAAGGEPAGAAEQRYLAHAADGFAFGLLISSSVWEHHFLFALPLVIVAWARRGGERPFAVLTASALVIALPTFDFFPLSYHRLAGLLALLVLSSPRALRSSAPRSGSP